MKLPPLQQVDHLGLTEQIMAVSLDPCESLVACRAARGVTNSTGQTLPAIGADLNLVGLKQQLWTPSSVSAAYATALEAPRSANSRASHFSARLDHVRLGELLASENSDATLKICLKFGHLRLEPVGKALCLRPPGVNPHGRQRPGGMKNNTLYK